MSAWHRGYPTDYKVPAAALPRRFPHNLRLPVTALLCVNGTENYIGGYAVRPVYIADIPKNHIHVTMNYVGIISAPVHLGQGCDAAYADGRTSEGV